jgi:predicted amidohydrolase YtcJ
MVIKGNGDAGLDMVLDQLEQNLKRTPRKEHRTVIVHFAVSRPEQVARIRRLGAIVSSNPYYPVALADNYRVNGLGPERADAMVRMGDVERAGISYSYHSDMPMAPGQPLFLIWAGVNRITNDGNVRGPEQRVSPLGALRAVTLDAAYSLQLEKQVGSIVPGKLANFTILAASPLKVDPVRIKDIAVWGTIQEGRILPVRQASGNSGISRLGPVLDQPTLAAVNRANASVAGHDHGDSCTLAKQLAMAANGTLFDQHSAPSEPSRLGNQTPKP